MNNILLPAASLRLGVFIGIAAFFLEAFLFRFFKIPIYIYLIPVVAVLFVANGSSRFVVFSNLILFGLFLKGVFYHFALDDFGYYLSVVLWICSFSLVGYCRFPNTGNSFGFLIVFLTVLMYCAYFFGVDFDPHMADLSAEGADPEYYREYHSGLFRSPHHASYLLYFSTLFLVSLRVNDWRRVCQLLCVATLLVLLLTTGVRTPIYALLVILSFLVARKNIGLSLFVLIAISFIFLFLDFFLSISEGTIFYQYFSFLYSLINNVSRLSRMQLASSFMEGVERFGFLEHMFGTSFSMSLDANEIGVGQRIWFHNDFLAIYFSYGLVGICLLVAIYVYLYNRLLIGKSSLVAQTYFYSIVLFSLFNGILYHPAPVILFLLMLIVRRSSMR